MSTGATYPLSAARAVALDAQGLAEQPDLDTPSTPEQVYAAVERVGCLQIDTLQMVRRSHYLALWSRLGAYDPEDLDALVYDPARRRLFEYWLHAASIIPLSEYRYRLLLMRHCAEGTFRSRRRWLEEPGNVETVDGVRRRVREEGAVAGLRLFRRARRRQKGLVGLEAGQARPGAPVRPGRVDGVRPRELSARVRPAGAGVA